VFEIFCFGEELGDAGLDVVEGVGERGELRYGVLLPLVGRFPVVHRPHHHRCRLDRLVCHLSN
jgi:hypothetical protein